MHDRNMDTHTFTFTIYIRNVIEIFMFQWPTIYQTIASAEKIINKMQNKFLTALSFI